MAGCSVQNLKGPKVINSIVGALKYMHVDFHTLLSLDRYIVGTLGYAFADMAVG